MEPAKLPGKSTRGGQEKKIVRYSLDKGEAGVLCEEKRIYKYSLEGYNPIYKLRRSSDKNCIIHFYLSR